MKKQSKDKQICFDNELYLKLQSENINKRIKKFNNKLYLEFGGKIFDDLHAARVLPGFDANIKIKLLQKMKDSAEIIFCISSNDIEKNKIRADLGLSYDNEVLRLVDNMRELGLYISAFVITLYKGQPSATKFGKKLEQRGERVFFHNYTKGYPNDVDTIVSDEGYGANPFVETTRPLVVVTAPGPSSGKLATCLSQLYHEYKRGVKAGYAKFETFPVWNLSLLDPVNIAYEAATADLKDVNMIDPFHLEAYGEYAVNYNRDISTFPILKNILLRITGKEVYKSPTDMGVNMIKQCITDPEVVKQASTDEIIRRYYNTLCDYKQKICTEDVVEQSKAIMDKLELTLADRKVAVVANEKAKEKGTNVLAIELNNGKIITGKETKLLSCTSAAFLNAIKELTGIPDKELLLSSTILDGIYKIKEKTSYNTSYSLSLPEVLIALSICSVTNPIIEKALSELEELRGCDAHASYIIEKSELNALKNLGISLTCEPRM